MMDINVILGQTKTIEFFIEIFIIFPLKSIWIPTQIRLGLVKFRYFYMNQSFVLTYFQQ